MNHDSEYVIDKIYEGLNHQTTEKIKELEETSSRWKFIIWLWKSRKENKENADNKD